MKSIIRATEVVLLCLFQWPNALAGPTESTWDIGRIYVGQCLYSSLLEKQLPSLLIDQIVADLSPHMNFKGLPPGTAYRFELDPAGDLQEFTIEARGSLLSLARTKDHHYTVQQGPVHLSNEIATVWGWYNSASHSVHINGEAAELSRRFSQLLLKELEVRLDLCAGDHFRLVVEKYYIGDRLLRYGPILAFEFSRGNLRLVAVRYGDEYYDENGRALKSRFLRFPLAYKHISSQFHKERKHPILGGVRPHQGIDFAAPVGTPVWAIADGEVRTAGWLNGFGRTLILRHADGYESLYAHLKGFAPKVREGTKIRQKQVIGYIGTTGLSTGSHLHYGLIRNGEHRDPLKEEFPRPLITNKRDYTDFVLKRESIVSILSTVEQTHAHVLEPEGPNARFISY